MANSSSATSPRPFSDLNTLWWVAAFALVVFGIKVAMESWIAGVMLIAFGIVVSPHVFSRILVWLSADDPVQVRVLIVLLALASSTYVLFEHTGRIDAAAAESSRVQALADAQAEEAKRAAEAEAKLSAIKADFAENRAAVLAEFAAAVDGKNLAAAQVIRDRFILAIRDPDFDLILNRYVDLKEEVALAETQKANKVRVAELIAQLTSVGAMDYDRAITIYSELVSLEPANKTYQQKLERFTRARDALAAKEAATQAAATAKAERRQKIEEQFSGYDGSHRKFERLIKQSMNDPDSYDHVETKYSDKGSFIRVFCTFRGKNAFGGLVKNTKVADFTIDGTFLQEVE